MSERIEALLNDCGWLSSAILAGLNSALSTHGSLTKANSVSAAKRILGNVKGALRAQLGLAKPARYDPYKREAAGYVCRPCSRSGRPSCEHVIDDLRRDLATVTRPIESYACQRCGRADGLDAVCPSEMWATIVDGALSPNGEVTDGRWTLLCLWCIDALALEKGLTFSVSLHFAGRAITGTSQSDADREHINRLAQRQV